MQEIKISSPYEDVKIGGEVFRINLSDENLLRMSREYDSLMNRLAESMAGVGGEEQKLNDAVKVMLEVLDILFDGKPSQRIYELCGRSLYSTMGVINEVAGMFQGKMLKKK